MSGSTMRVTPMHTTINTAAMKNMGRQPSQLPT